MKITIMSNKDYPEARKLKSSFDVSAKGEICVAIGGDGTFVSAAKSFDGPILPIRSGEKGSIGYYSDLCLGDIDFVIENLKKRRFSIEKLENKIEVLYKGKIHTAVNEALLHNIDNEVSFKIYEISKGKRYEIYPYVMSGDGALVTGVIGSTAYNKSAGGPIILSPHVVCLTFLNVDGPYKNPIIIDATKELEIEISKYSGILRSDGTEIGKLHKGGSFRVRLSKKELNIVRFRQRREKLADKLERVIVSRMVK
ncbi:MAG: NAD(+)/NADH kinase [Candidatus Micrarchaeota archaeon]|nr:NAD(+)/NADH kinase [Candidatus Micrarchaeota archaeon]MDE1849961.1 NAD(+)/NADH kinase [Candidatus Micrarchaeota archaeon]